MCHGLRLAGLDPATRVSSFICFFKERSPVGYRAEQIAHVDKVKCVCVPGPRLGAVVDLELQVGWDPGGLCGREICADDGCVWMLVGIVTYDISKVRFYMYELLLTLPKYLGVEKVSNPLWFYVSW